MEWDHQLQYMAGRIYTRMYMCAKLGQGACTEAGPPAQALLHPRLYSFTEDNMYVCACNLMMPKVYVNLGKPRGPHIFCAANKLEHLT